MNHFMNKSNGPINSSNLYPENLNSQCLSYSHSPFDVDNLNLTENENGFLELKEHQKQHTNHNNHNIFIENFLVKLEQELNTYLQKLIKNKVTNNTKINAKINNIYNNIKCNINTYNQMNNNNNELYKYSEDNIINSFIQFDCRKNSDSVSQVSYLDNLTFNNTITNSPNSIWDLEQWEKAKTTKSCKVEYKSN